MKRHTDNMTRSLFDEFSAKVIPGSLNIDKQLRSLLSALLKKNPLSRYEVAARMSELTGNEITKHQLDSWTAESREGWRFPLEFMPALEVALETHALTTWLGDLRGCRVLIGKEALEAELCKVNRIKADLLEKEKALKNMLQ